VLHRPVELAGLIGTYHSGHITLTGL